jgi:hypothetical protein
LIDAVRGVITFIGYARGIELDDAHGTCIDAKAATLAKEFINGHIGHDVPPHIFPTSKKQTAGRSAIPKDFSR